MPNITIHNAHLSRFLISAIAFFCDWTSIPTGNAQSLPSQTLPQQRSYVGIGGATGLQGTTTSLSSGGFALLSKRVLTENLAIHSANTIFGSSVSASAIALTYNQPIDRLFTPFLGGGIMTYYENGVRIVPLITGGVDLSISEQLTGTIRTNVGFVSDRQADVGILFGIGLNY
ncbi:hypothetical protein [Chamaesiphon sp.]|uniref:hypothetical protein n=1 Tax=Chamaesiphon sp. TaxID=2814140 RepID=UPI0035942CCB